MFYSFSFFEKWQCSVSKRNRRVGSVCEYRADNGEDESDDPQPASVTLPLNYRGLALRKEQPFLVTCPNGQITHVFLMCGSQPFSVCGQAHTHPCSFPRDVSSNHGSSQSSDPDAASDSSFICDDGAAAVSHTLVCDFRFDCRDKSDELFCKHPPCFRMFTCTNGQCVPYDKMCDNIGHCQDKLDESQCEVFRIDDPPMPGFPSPALVNFNGIDRFTSVPMDSNVSCPDTHYRCPGDISDCLPVYTRCNGMNDCFNHEDEEECEDMKCSGFFRCRASRVCLHGDNLCDGWPHCPMSDDELVCYATCPVGCLCQGHSFLCHQPFHASHFPQLRYLDATGSGMTLSGLISLAYIVRLILVRCSLTVVPQTELFNLRKLDLTGNRLQHINMTHLSGLANLRSLSLSQNPLTSLYFNPLSTVQQRALSAIDMSYVSLDVFDTKVLSQFVSIQKLNLSFTDIHTINISGFQFTPQLTELHMTGSPVAVFPPDLFKGLSRLHFISAQNQKLCCKDILPHHFDVSYCYAPKDEISSCEDLLHSGLYRVFLWLVSSLSLTCNAFCFAVRLFAKTKSASGFSVFVINLNMGDFLMGVYVVIIGIADEWFRGRYLHYDLTWKNSTACKVAGFLSLVSSEVSAMTILLITLDRFIVIRFPFSTLRFERPHATLASLLTWLVSWFIAVLPLLPMTSHWEFYSQTGICIPLPVTRKEFKGRYYSFSVLIVFNFVMFLFISSGQAFIYWSVQKNALSSNSTKVSRDLTIARRLITVAVSDFLCWFPIGLCGFLALAGTPIPGEVNVALAVFILPLNSALNPFLYTFNTLAEKRRKSNDARLLKWLETHSNLMDM